MNKPLNRTANVSEVLAQKPRLRDLIRERLYAQNGGSFLDNCPLELWKSYTDSDSCVFISRAGSLNSIISSTSSRANNTEIAAALKSDTNVDSSIDLAARMINMRVSQDGESSSIARVLATSRSQESDISSNTWKLDTRRSHYSNAKLHELHGEQGYKIRKRSTATPTSSLYETSRGEFTKETIDRLYHENNVAGLRKLRKQLEEHAQLLQYMRDKEMGDDYRFASQKKALRTSIDETEKLVLSKKPSIADDKQTKAFHDMVSKKRSKTSKLKHRATKQLSKIVSVKLNSA